MKTLPNTEELNMIIGALRSVEKQIYNDMKNYAGLAKDWHSNFEDGVRNGTYVGLWDAKSIIHDQIRHYRKMKKGIFNND